MQLLNTLGISVDIPTAIFLSVLSAIAACGASGVAGGSLLLIPMACSLFGINNDIAMQVVGVGFIIGVVQDSLETAINSSGDVLFAATAEYREMDQGRTEIASLSKCFTYLMQTFSIWMKRVDKEVPQYLVLRDFF